jgi:hypothetical protein
MGFNTLQLTAATAVLTSEASRHGRIYFLAQAPGLAPAARFVPSAQLGVVLNEQGVVASALTV